MSLIDKMSNLTLMNNMNNMNNMNWKDNIIPGSRIKLNNNDNEYIFYGYNHDKSIICCFTADSSNIAENSLYTIKENIEKLL